MELPFTKQFMSNPDKISLIVPCYNEITNIQKGVLDKIGNFTKINKQFSEVLIVDDGSTDDSRAIIREKYLNQFPKFRLIENLHQGKAFAIITGIEQSTCPYVMFTDIDLATPIEEASKLIAEITNSYQIIIGSRKSNRQGAPLARKILSLGSVIVREYILGLKGIHDTQCGFKLFERDIAIKILKKLIVFHNKRHAKGSSVSAGFDMEFLFLATKLGYKIKEVSVTWKHVETKNVIFFKDAVETLTDIIKIKIHDISGAYNEK